MSFDCGLITQSPLLFLILHAHCFYFDFQDERLDTNEGLLIQGIGLVFLLLGNCMILVGLVFTYGGNNQPPHFIFFVINTSAVSHRGKVTLKGRNTLIITPSLSCQRHPYTTVHFTTLQPPLICIICDPFHFFSSDTLVTSTLLSPIFFSSVCVSFKSLVLSY